MGRTLRVYDRRGLKLRSLVGEYSRPLYSQIGNNMKITYWLAKNNNDESRAYDLREKTKKEILEAISIYDLGDYQSPEKITAECSDTFSLIKNCLGEGGPDFEWE